jgi:hypothetical protein
LPPSCSLCAFPLKRLYWKPIQSLWTENLDERKLSSVLFRSLPIRFLPMSSFGP